MDQVSTLFWEWLPRAMLALVVGPLPTVSMIVYTCRMRRRDRDDYALIRTALAKNPKDASRLLESLATVFRERQESRRLPPWHRRRS